MCAEHKNVYNKVLRDTLFRNFKALLLNFYFKHNFMHFIFQVIGQRKCSKCHQNLILYSKKPYRLQFCTLIDISFQKNLKSLSDLLWIYRYFFIKEMERRQLLSDWVINKELKWLISGSQNLGRRFLLWLKQAIWKKFWKFSH